ncbi:MAG: hypothetical protein AAFN11_01760 [Chloroflexota bacterium]
MSKLQWSVLLGVLLLGSALRMVGTPDLAQSLHYDEAYYIADAYTLLENPRLTPFFPGNFGRESAWMYLLAPVLAILGNSIFALRIFAGFVGLLTIASTYRLSYTLFQNRWLAIWSAGGLAVLYWHVHFSYILWRALLFPLVGTLTFICLWQAYQHNKTRDWILTGVLLVILGHTYFAARVWFVLAFAMLGLILCNLARRHYSNAKERSIDAGQLRGTLVTAVIAVVGMLPLTIYTITNPALANNRIEDVAVTELSGILANIPTWLQTWFIEGPYQLNYNLPLRPVFDTPLLIMWGVGIFAIWWLSRDRIKVGWVLLLALGSAGISLITDRPENLIRMIGTVIPIALLIGAGAYAFQQLLNRFLPQRLTPFAAIVPACLLLWAGSNTYVDYQRWLDEDLYFLMENHILEMSATVDERDDNLPVYVSPFSPTHPVVKYVDRQLAENHVDGFDATQCWVIPEEDTLFFNLTVFDETFTERLSTFADVTPIYENERDALYYVSPKIDNIVPLNTSVFDNDMAVGLTNSLPETVAQGEVLDVTLSVKLQAHIPDDVTAFMHLYGDPTPYEGGTLWAQTDQPLCPSHPMLFTDTDEHILQPVQLAIPADTPPDTYDVALGFYNTRTQERIMIEDSSYIILDSVTVIGDDGGS